MELQSLVCIKPGQFEYEKLTRPLFQQGHSIIEIKRIGICGTDLHAFEGTQPYFNYPRVLGHELAAIVSETEAASGFQEGEPVTIIPYFHCGACIACRNKKPNCCVNMQVCGVHVNGGMTNYLSVPNHSLIKSEGLSFDQLALIEPLAIGAHGVSRADVKKGEFVLVVGAGPIGLGTMEMAKIAGANVIAMDVNDQRLLFCTEKLNVAHVINSMNEDAGMRLKEITNGDMPSVIIDATGNLKAINSLFQFMAHGARYVLIGLQKENISFSHPEFHKREATLMSSRNATKKDFEHVVHCLKNKLINPLTYITHRLKFTDVKNDFPGLLEPSKGVIKAMIEME